MMTILDAEALKVPLGLFLSKDEPADVGERIIDLLRFKTFSSKCQVRTWGDMCVFLDSSALIPAQVDLCATYLTRPHGFPGARGDLRLKPVTAAYLELYTALARFFLSCQRADHTGQSIVSAPENDPETVDVVEEDVGREGLANGESIEGKVRDEKQRQRRWFGRRKPATSDRSTQP